MKIKNECEKTTRKNIFVVSIVDDSGFRCLTCQSIYLAGKQETTETNRRKCNVEEGWIGNGTVLERFFENAAGSCQKLIQNV